jgi:hypothetical protein
MILNSPTISGSLTVTGNILTSGSITLSGSVASASYALSASNAQTASFANSFTVAGTLTAQTLVVQTITSSVDFVTGSTKFGSLSENTHQFTGSILTSGSIGIGITPSISPIEILSTSDYAFRANRTTTNSKSLIALYDSPTAITSSYLIVGVDPTGNTVGYAATGSFISVGTNGTGVKRDLILHNYDAQSVVIATNNTERMRVTSIGRVGIGTSNPADKLHISNNGAEGMEFGFETNKAYMFAYNRSTSAYIPFILQAGGGNVGIGTNSPTNGKLEVQTGSTAAGLWVQTGGTTSGYVIADFRTGTNLSALNILGNGNSIFGGNVGIGTSSPGDKLTIKGTGNYVGMSVDNGGTTGGGYYAAKQNGESCGFFGVSGAAIGDTSNDITVFAEGGRSIRFYTNGSVDERMRITSAGQVGIGLTNPGGFVLNVQSVAANNSSTPHQIALFGNSTSGASRGYLYIGSSAGIDWLVGKDTGGSGDYRFNLSLYTGEQRMILYTNGNYSFAGSNVSDLRLKSNINSISINALDKVSQLSPKSYYMNDHPDQIRYGFIAQEVKDILPDLISGTEGEKEYLGLDYNGVLTVAVKAIQELKAQNDDLQSQINELKAQ